MSKKGEKNPTTGFLTKEDLELWEKITADVNPLKQNKEKLHIETTQSSPKKFKKKNLSELPVVETNKANTKEKVIKSREIDASRERKLRRGTIDIEATLDLHGKSQQQAYQDLKEFITKCHIKKLRCLLIITGKGRFSTDNGKEQKNKGILRQKLPIWLEETHFNDLVLKVNEAHVKHGGSGAFYVLLRKNTNK